MRPKKIIKRVQILHIIKSILLAIAICGFIFFSLALDSEGTIYATILKGEFISMGLIAICLVLERYIICTLYNNHINIDYKPVFFWADYVYAKNKDTIYEENKKYYDWLAEENLEDTDDIYTIYKKYIEE